jgi:hypothetical protein
MSFYSDNVFTRQEIKALRGYPREALEQDLERLSSSWDTLQQQRHRDAIYVFLREVFELVAWWEAEKKSARRAMRVLDLKAIATPNELEPYAILIRAAAHPSEIDKRSVSKWSRVLRYAALLKISGDNLQMFIKDQGGLNRCAEKYGRFQRSVKDED